MTPLFCACILEYEKYYIYYMHKHHIYGTASVNEKGQIVIPAEARKDLGLSPEDKLMVIGGHGKALCLVRSDVFEKRMRGVMGWFFSDRPKEEKE